MQQNQLIQQQPIVAEALALLTTLTGSQHPTQLELYIQNLAQSQHNFEGLMQAVEKQQLNENSTKLLCMLISKVLQRGHLEEMVELKAFMRLALNWSLPSSCKKMLEIDLRRFIKTISSEHLNYIFLLVECVQQLITSISKERIKKRYESSPFEMEGMQLTIYVNFPHEFVPMVQTYLLFMESVLYTNEGLHFMRTLTQNFRFLKTLHALIFEPKNIIDHPHLFGSLFQFWTELLQLYSNISQLKEFLGIVQHLGCMTAHISMVYEVLCHSEQEGIDYMQMEGHQNAAQIMKLKAQVCEFHTTLLSQIRNCKMESVLLKDLSCLLPSLLKTAQKYLTSRNFEHAYEQDLIKNLLPLLSIAVEVTVISNEDLVSLLVNLAIPFLQMGIQNTEQNEVVGEDLHAILDDCCQLQSSGDLLSVAAQLLEKIFQNSDALVDYFYQLVHHSITHRFQLNQEQSALNLQSRALSLKAVFLGLSLSAYHEDQKYTTICGQLAQLVSSQFLQVLSESELQFFFHFMNFSWIIFYEEDRSKLQMLIEYALSPSCFKRPTLQFFALQFLHCIFNELSTTQWLLKFIEQMEMYKSAQSIGRKWAIFQHVVISNIIDFDASKIVWVVECMHAGASRELQRMESQKRQRHMVEYGQVNEYLSSLTNLQKKLGRNFMRRQIVHSLLDFASMLDRAGLFNLEKELLKIAINVFPLCWKNPQLIAKGLKVLQKILVIFVQRSYRGNGCLLAIFSGINTFKDDENLSATLLRVVSFGSRSVANNQSTLQDSLLSRSLLCLLCLLQKYLISFPILDQHKTTLSSTYHQIATLCQTALEHHTQNLHMLAAKYHLTTTIHCLLIDRTIDWHQLRTGAAEGWFQKYDAFILLHTFTLIVRELEIETKRMVVQIGLLLLCCHQLHKKCTKQDMLNRREPLEELHKTVDSVIYEKNLAEQVWVLFQCCGINSEDKCTTMFPTFSRQAFDYLMFCRCIPSPRTQQEQIEYSKIKLAKTKQLHHKLSRLPKSAQVIDADSGIVCERKIVRVTGDKLDSIFYSDQKTTFKRNIHKRFIDHSQVISGCYSDSSLTNSDSQEGENSTPSKKLIDNYFMEHRAVRTMVNLSSAQKLSRREERCEKVGRMLLAADMKHLRTGQDE